MEGSRALRLRRQNRPQGDQGNKAQLQESTTYSELLATTIPAKSSQSADKVAQTLGIIQNGRRSSSRDSDCHSLTYQTVDVASDKADSNDDEQLADQLESTLRLSPVSRLQTSPLTAPQILRCTTLPSNHKRSRPRPRWLCRAKRPLSTTLVRRASPSEP